MVAFVKDVVDELIHHDGLWVFAQGLDVHGILLDFLRAFQQRAGDVPPLVFLLGAPAEEQKILAHRAVLRQQNGVTVLNAEVPPEERQAQTAKGGCFLVTPRILVTDLLTGKIPAEMITGIVAMHAHLIRRIPSTRSASD